MSVINLHCTKNKNFDHGLRQNIYLCRITPEVVNGFLKQMMESLVESYHNLLATFAKPLCDIALPESMVYWLPVCAGQSFRKPGMKLSRSCVY